MDFAGLYQVDRKKKSNRMVLLTKTFLIPFLIIISIAFVLQLTLRKLVIFPVKIETNAMSPSISPNKTKFFIYPYLGTVKKGDIVFARHENMDFLCRIAGAPGEALQILDKSLFINHVEVKNYSPASNDSAIFSSDISPRDNTGEFLIGPQEFFCLNDNWENTLDSRQWGPISQKDLKGIVAFP